MSSLNSTSFDKYSIGLVCGPTNVPLENASFYSIDYASSDLEQNFFELYVSAQKSLGKLLNIKKDIDNAVVIMSGEAMVALWGALKSVIKPGDKVLAIGTGLYGYGIGDMAKKLGAIVEFVSLKHNEGVTEQHQELIRSHAERFRPKLITVVHCETPSGVLNNIEVVGRVSKAVDALLYVDFVSSGGCVPICVSEWGIDLGLLGTQKGLNLPPDLGIITVSEKAWKVIEDVQYVGYDAIADWKDCVKKNLFPYTHNWRAVAALNHSVHKILSEGDEKVYQRHREVAQLCVNRAKKAGIQLYPVSQEISSPSVTALYVPSGWTWQEFDTALRKEGLVVSNTYGDISEKVFRIGHMGVQANAELINQAFDIIEKVLSQKK